MYASIGQAGTYVRSWLQGAPAEPAATPTGEQAGSSRESTPAPTTTAYGRYQAEKIEPETRNTVGQSTEGAAHSGDGQRAQDRDVRKMDTQELLDLLGKRSQQRTVFIDQLEDRLLWNSSVSKKKPGL